MHTWFKPARPILPPWRQGRTGTDEILDVCFANRDRGQAHGNVSYPWPERERIKREARHRAGYVKDDMISFMRIELYESELRQARGEPTLGVLEMQELAECGS